MALTEAKIKDLADKKFDRLFEKHHDVWAALARTAFDYAKKNITGGRKPRPDDVAKVLYPMLEVDEKLREHQENNKARASRYVTWFTEYVMIRHSTGVAPMKTGDSVKGKIYFELARRYVDEQLATMKKHGSVRKISREQYELLVKKVASATAK